MRSRRRFTEAASTAISSEHGIAMQPTARSMGSGRACEALGRLQFAAVASCRQGTSDPQLEALVDDPLADLLPEGTEETFRIEQPAGVALGNPVHPEVSRRLRISEPARSDAVLAAALDAAADAGWSVEDPSGVIRVARKQLADGTARATLSIMEVYGKTNLVMVLDFAPDP